MRATEQRPEPSTEESASPLRPPVASDGITIALPLGESRPSEVDWEALVGPEWLEWYSLTPQERWAESEKLWQVYLYLGGSLDPEPDTQSPFFDPDEPVAVPADGGASLHCVRRSGV